MFNHYSSGLFLCFITILVVLNKNTLNDESKFNDIENVLVNKTDETEIENSNDKDIIILITTNNENTLNDNDESQLNNSFFSILDIEYYFLF
jgi:hypothetical protein